MKSKRKNLPSITDPYLDFLRSVRLKGIGLEESSIELDRGALAEISDDTRQLSVAIETDFNVGMYQSDKFVILCAFSMAQTKVDTEESLVKMSGVYSALFECALSADEELSRRFAKREARLVFWPYLRFFVSDMCNRMAIKTILLPLTTQFDSEVPVIQTE